MAEWKKYPTMQSPRGVFKWPKLTSVDYGTKEYPNPDGSYNVRLVMANRTAVVFEAELKDAFKEAVDLAKVEFSELKIETRKKLEKLNGKGGLALNPLAAELFDKETEEPTGDTEFRFKMKASGVRKDGSRWNRKPGIFDAKGETFPRGIDIWGGTVGIIAFKAEPYFVPANGMVGLTLKIQAVQVLDLVSAGSRTASEYGFGVEEGCDGSTLEVPEAAPAMEADADNNVAAPDGHNF